MDITKIKQIRLELDTIYNSFQFLKPSRHISLASTGIEMAKMQLGKVLNFLNAPNPYPDSTNTSNNKIEPQADHSQATLKAKFDEIEGGLTEKEEPNFHALNIQIARVKCMRGEIKSVIEKITLAFGQSGLSEDNVNLFLRIHLTQVYLRADESVMWLGRELNSIHELTTSESKPA